MTEETVGAEGTAPEPAIPDPFELPEQPAPEDQAGLSPLLTVGKPVVFYLGGHRDENAMQRGVVRGWHAGGYLLIEVPQFVPRESADPAGSSVLMKFRHDGVTHEFDASIEGLWSGMAPPHFVLAWPSEVRRVEVRRHERIVSLVQVNLVTENGAWLKGQLRDLSAGGCKLYLRTPAETGSVVQLSMSLPDGSTLEDVRAVVKAVNPFGKGALVSCQFDESETGAREEVDLYVASALDEVRARRLPERRRVVVMGGSPKLLAHLRRALDQRGFDVVTATGPVDGFAMIRSTAPHAVLINEAQAALSGFDLVRVLRATPGMRRLPVFVFGPEDARHAAAARAVGATDYLPYLVSPGRLADSVMSQGVEG